MAASFLLLLTSVGLFLSAQAQDCSRPVGGENMGLKGDAVLLESFPDGKKVAFACDVGFVAAGGSASVTCTAGSWSALRMTCDKVDCKEPYVKFGHWDSGSRGPYTYKTTVTFKCNEGYRMTNSATITCEINERWEPELPKCEGCPSPSGKGTIGEN
ncbi:zona pellucida sperm-binding protein 3 receptor-like isoform X2 [Pseudochaenichthys georgianus]|uniref:zona pellucida sperm-binding protein 3 receptor-like isoform X2 n=1 Tax=Pseudochaenichthys georgianus TaxID=52239 RepID=UPI0039C2346E